MIVSSGAVIGIALLVVIGVCIRYCVTKQALVKIQEEAREGVRRDMTRMSERMGMELAFGQYPAVQSHAYTPLMMPGYSPANSGPYPWAQGGGYEAIPADNQKQWNV